MQIREKRKEEQMNKQETLKKNDEKLINSLEKRGRT